MSAALQEEFERIDTNGDGKLDWQELAAGCNVPEVEARSLVDFFDYDEDGALNFAEFVTMQKVFMKQDSNAVEMSAVASAFKAWDKNGDGELEVGEMTSLKNALKIEDEVWYNIVNKCDINKDGKIDRKEFKLMCQAINRKDDAKFKNKPAPQPAAAPADVKPSAAATDDSTGSNTSLGVIFGVIIGIAALAGALTFAKSRGLIKN